MHVGKRDHFMTQAKGVEINTDHSCGCNKTGVGCSFLCSRWSCSCFSPTGFVLAKASQRRSLGFDFQKRSVMNENMLLHRCHRALLCPAFVSFLNSKV